MFRRAALFLTLVGALTASGLPHSALGAEPFPRDLEEGPCKWTGLRKPVRPGETGYFCRGGEVHISQAVWEKGRCSVETSVGKGGAKEVLLEMDSSGTHSIKVGTAVIATPTFEAVEFEDKRRALKYVSWYDPDEGSWTLNVINAATPRFLAGSCKAGSYSK